MDAVSKLFYFDAHRYQLQVEAMARQASPDRAGAAASSSTSSAADTDTTTDRVRQRRSAPLESSSRSRLAPATLSLRRQPQPQAVAPDIVFVGAGPVGLWAAIQLKLRKPHLNISMLEKYEAYSRDNHVKLNHETLSGSVNDDWGIIKQLRADLEAQPFIPIQLLENTLKDLARQLLVQIQIVPGGVTDVRAQVLDRYENAAFIIGSDGAHSVVRTQLFSADNFQKQPLRYAAHVKYTIAGTAEKIDKKELAFLLQKTHSHLAHEHVGRCNDGKTAMTLQIFIDKNTYDKLKGGATAKNPVHVFSSSSQGAIPHKLLDDIKSLLGLRLVKHGSSIDPSTVRLSVTEISQHQCRTVLEPCQRQGRYQALLGDAALGLSFFRGLNSGIKSANKFSAIVGHRWEKPDNAYASKYYNKFSKYQEWYDQHSATAISKGSFKNLQLSGIDTMMAIGSKISLWKYSDKDIRRFKKAAEALG